MDYHLKQWKPQHESDQFPSAKTPKLFEAHREPSGSALPLFVPEPNSRISNLSVFPDSTTTTRVPRMGSFFSLDQWRELELQALIFKYLLAGAAVPPELLYPIKKSLLGSSGCYIHHQCEHNQPSVMQSGYWGRSGVDPEPGRCRRTDGKKWRCSRDVVAGHKYCERHLNRGRNRSRKPVEIPTSTSTVVAGSVLNPTQITASSLTAVASGSPFSLCSSSSSLDLLHLNHRSFEGKARNGGDLGIESSGVSMGEGRPVGRGVLRHFFDDWPRMHHQHHDHHNGEPNTTTCLSISVSGNGNASAASSPSPSSDFSLKLSTGNGDYEAEEGSEHVRFAGERHQQQQLVNNYNSNWSSMGWGSHPVVSMGGGPLAEALRSSTSHCSPTSVLLELPRGAASEASSVST
ncbi:growth-regulating factor 3-like [Macadamia integrifolia]|uniref:growth-regulating factor 3-like n=1 Tax=Macadamia integrifolia TaxID=60698 RepID=UPI001C531BE9|nr:growth-regulating factor 3-like [Macadamia integrifolia]